MNEMLVWSLIEIFLGVYFLYKLYKQKKNYYFIIGIVFLGIGFSGLLNKFYDDFIFYKYAFGTIEIVMGGFFFILFNKNSKKIVLFSAILITLLGLERIFSTFFLSWIFNPNIWSILHIIAGFLLIKAYDYKKDNVYLISAFILFMLSFELLILNY